MPQYIITNYMCLPIYFTMQEVCSDNTKIIIVLNWFIKAYSHLILFTERNQTYLIWQRLFLKCKSEIFLKHPCIKTLVLANDYLKANLISPSKPCVFYVSCSTNWFLKSPVMLLSKACHARHVNWCKACVLCLTRSTLWSSWLTWSTSASGPTSTRKHDRNSSQLSMTLTGRKDK